MNRREIRQQYANAWQKAQQGQPLSALEASIADVIATHPEYHAAIEQIAKNPEQDFFAELGETNPFLHMGLHLGLREQISTDRPAGIRAIYADLCKQHSQHDAEHKMIEVLAKALWEAERAGKLPDEAAYLEALKTLS